MADGKSFIYMGWLTLDSNGEEDDILYLRKDEQSYRGDEPLAEQLEDITNRMVTVRYFICDRVVTLEEAEEQFIRRFYGELDANYAMCFSEITGYLWTNEELNVGGHDLLAELKSNAGKYLILSVVVHDEV